MNVLATLKAGTKSAVTTWTGVITAVIAIGMNLLYLVDGDPDTVPDAESVGIMLIGIFVFFQGLASRDANKTSEESKR